MVNKMNGESLDLKAQNIARLKELFPEILTDGDKIDFDMLKTVLGDEVDSENERYQFTWHGKKKMITGTQKPSKGTLRPVPEKSKNFDTTENLYIEGDSLEVLKLLQKSYNGKIKMIYIDPPYNTGKDFVYKDNFKDGVQNYLEQTGQVDTEGNILSTNTENNGRFHTDWLNMIYPRLKLARGLLKNTGAIFISIDDNEVTNLRRVCDEIYGENNFVECLVWKRRATPPNDRAIGKNHEYILIYAKDIIHLELGLQKRSEELNSRYKNPDNDPRGPWAASDLSANGKGGRLVESCIYPIYNADDNVEHYPPENKCWLYNQEKMNLLLAEGRIGFRENSGKPFLKRYLSEVRQGSTLPTILDNCGFSQDSAKEIKQIFSNDVFEFSKPLSLIKTLLITGLDKNEIVLDFFSGSGTVAQATMELNAEDNGKRKFIVVQIPEITQESSIAYKNGYLSISQIGQERIRRAGDKIKAELKEKQQKAGMLDENVVNPEALDIGFKLLKLDSSNIREWNVDFESIKEELDLYATPFIVERSELDIVYEIILKQGLELTYPIETFEVSGKTIYDIAFGSLFICLANGITTDVAKAIIARRDELGTETSSVIFSDAGFSNDSDKLNSIEILKDAGYPEDNLLTI